MLVWQIVVLHVLFGAWTFGHLDLEVEMLMRRRVFGLRSQGQESVVLKFGSLESSLGYEVDSEQQHIPDEIKETNQRKGVIKLSEV